MVERVKIKGKRAAIVAAACGIAVLVWAGIALREDALGVLREEWRLRKLRSTNPPVRGDYATKLGAMGSRRAASFIGEHSRDDVEALDDLGAYFFGLQFFRPGWRRR